MSKKNRQTAKRGADSLHHWVWRQALDEANHVSHELRISALGRGITVGRLKQMLAKLDIPDDAKIKFALRGFDEWALLESMSFCRPANEVSLW